MHPFFDSHAHLSGAELFAHASSVIERARAAGVTRILNVCTELESLEKGLRLSARYPEVKNAGSSHPQLPSQEAEACFCAFEQAARARQLVAIGETGLDYHYTPTDKPTQQRFLIRYLHLAAELGLPVIFHCREAFDDLFAITDAEYPRTGRAILHCFTGTMKEAEQVWKRGWHLSLSGIVTFKKSEALRQVARETSLSQLLIETDAPYLAPQSRRGQFNEPAWVVETAACVAAARGMPLAELAEATFANAAQLFGT